MSTETTHSSPRLFRFSYCLSFPYFYYLNTDSVSLALIPFYFTDVRHIVCSGINPLTHQSASSPCFVRFTSSHRPVPFCPPVVIKSCSREAVQSISAHEKKIHVHVQFTNAQFTPTVHTLGPTSLTLRSYRSTDSVQRLSQTTADSEVLAPPVAQHTTPENLTFDSPTDRSFYNPENYQRW